MLTCVKSSNVLKVALAQALYKVDHGRIATVTVLIRLHRIDQVTLILPRE